MDGERMRAAQASIILADCNFLGLNLQLQTPSPGPGCNVHPAYQTGEHSSGLTGPVLAPAPSHVLLLHPQIILHHFSKAVRRG